MAPEEPKRIEHLLVPGLGLAFITSRPGMDYGKKPFRRIRLDAMADAALLRACENDADVAATSLYRRTAVCLSLIHI